MDKSEFTKEDVKKKTTLVGETRVHQLNRFKYKLQIWDNTNQQL